MAIGHIGQLVIHSPSTWHRRLTLTFYLERVLLLNSYDCTIKLIRPLTALLTLYMVFQVSSVDRDSKVKTTPGHIGDLLADSILASFFVAELMHCGWVLSLVSCLSPPSQCYHSELSTSASSLLTFLPLFSQRDKMANWD